MSFVLKRRLQPLHGLLDLAPVATVVLLLLTFFLLSSSFVLQPGIKVDPPHSGIWSGTPSSRLIVAVTLGPTQMDVSGNPLLRQPVLYFNDQIVTIDGLRDALNKLPPSRTTPSLVLKADKDVTLDLITQVENVAFEHHFFVVTAIQPDLGVKP